MVRKAWIEFFGQHFVSQIEIPTHPKTFPSFPSPPPLLTTPPAQILITRNLFSSLPSPSLVHSLLPPWDEWSHPHTKIPCQALSFLSATSEPWSQPLATLFGDFLWWERRNWFGYWRGKSMAYRIFALSCQKGGSSWTGKGRVCGWNVTRVCWKCFFFLKGLLTSRSHIFKQNIFYGLFIFNAILS